MPRPSLAVECSTSSSLPSERLAASRCLIALLLILYSGATGRRTSESNDEDNRHIAYALILAPEKSCMYIHGSANESENDLHLRQRNDVRPNTCSTIISRRYEPMLLEPQATWVSCETDEDLI